MRECSRALVKKKKSGSLSLRNGEIFVISSFVITFKQNVVVVVRVRLVINTGYVFAELSFFLTDWFVADLITSFKVVNLQPRVVHFRFHPVMTAYMRALVSTILCLGWAISLSTFAVFHFPWLHFFLVSANLCISFILWCARTGTYENIARIFPRFRCYQSMHSDKYMYEWKTRTVKLWGRRWRAFLRLIEDDRWLYSRGSDMLKDLHVYFEVCAVSIKRSKTKSRRRHLSPSNPSNLVSPIFHEDSVSLIKEVRIWA